MDYEKRASTLFEKVKDSERGQETEYSPNFVRCMVVNTRQDMVLVVSLLNSLNGQVQTLKYLLVGILLVLVLILLK